MALCASNQQLRQDVLWAKYEYEYTLEAMAAEMEAHRQLQREREEMSYQLSQVGVGE